MESRCGPAIIDVDGSLSPGPASGEAAAAGQTEPCHRVARHYWVAVEELESSYQISEIPFFRYVTLT